ncbi:Lpg1974 family pore-forming outer membrane protein [Aestuariivirga sp.]|uniref:Lpg1974 family pore-forming outer membrane protein n=1 Tax=Aestuariivirga sp. TaxID=2650926 RepID=UPI0039E2865E
MLMHVRLMFAAVVALAAMAGNAASGDVPRTSSKAGVFGHISTSYLLKDPAESWKLDTGYTEAGLGDGFIGDGRLGYRWSDWDVAVGGQVADLSRGDASHDLFSDFYLSANHFALDGEIGHRVVLGAADVRTHFGLRYAEWAHEVSFPGLGGLVRHDFRGLGPRLGISTVTPVSDNLSLEFDVAASLLFGKNRTQSISFWNCSDCTTEHVTAVNLEGSAGIGLDLGQSVHAVAGWQGQYWGDVNVAITDESGLGENVSSSGHFMTGPSLRFAF